MTIEMPKLVTVMRSALALGAGAALTLACWVALVAALTFTLPAGSAVAVAARSDLAAGAIVAAGGRLVDAGPLFVIARFDEPGFVPRLYAAGALLVIDAQAAGGCRGVARKSAAAVRS